MDLQSCLAGAVETDSPRLVAVARRVGRKFKVRLVRRVRIGREALVLVFDDRWRTHVDGNMVDSRLVHLLRLFAPDQYDGHGHAGGLWKSSRR